MASCLMPTSRRSWLGVMQSMNTCGALSKSQKKDEDKSGQIHWSGVYWSKMEKSLQKDGMTI